MSVKWGKKKNEADDEEHATTNSQLRSQRLKEAREKGMHTKEEWEEMKTFFGECVICGDKESIVKDHIIPLYQGGSDAITNLQPLCRTCNSRKGPDNKDYRLDWCRSHKIEMPNKWLTKDEKCLTINKIKEININPPKSPKGDISPLPGDVPAKSSQKRFQKPTVGEIDAYCKERGNGVDPQRFFDYYESKGWVVGKSPMKDWKAAVRTWERQDKDMKPYQPQAPPLQSPEEEEAEVMRILQERKSRKDNGL